jgi:hypothetical protein
VIPIKSGKLDRRRSITYPERARAAVKRLELPIRWHFGIAPDVTEYTGPGRRLTAASSREKGATANG